MEIGKCGLLKVLITPFEWRSGHRASVCSLYEERIVLSGHDNSCLAVADLRSTRHSSFQVITNTGSCYSKSLSSLCKHCDVDRQSL